MKAFSHFHSCISFERSSKSKGYTIRIDGLTYESDRKLIRNVATSLSLKVKEDADGISII
jgi:hypothetical protein